MGFERDLMVISWDLMKIFEADLRFDGDFREI